MKHLATCLLLATTLLVGCATTKNPGPAPSAHFSDNELRDKLDITVHVEMPEIRDLDDMIPDETKIWVYERARFESQRLVEILRKCELFKNVVTRRIDPNLERIVTVKALPRKTEGTGFEDPMILIYGGIIPIYSKNNHGVSFALVESNSDFHFEWTEETVIGLIAPVMSATQKNWSSKRENEDYWNQLRAKLHAFFKANKN